MDSNNEVKEWLAIAEYLKSFNKVNGVAQIPQYYSKLQGRKIVDNNHSLLQYSQILIVLHLQLMPLL